MNALEIEQTNKLNRWTDVSWGKGKGVGYIQIWKKTKKGFKCVESIGKNELKKLEKYKNKTDVYFTINSFKPGISRKMEDLKQYRAIVVDLDIYKKNISYIVALETIQERINAGDIPSPSMITFSNGIHLYYSIYDGAAVNIRTSNMYNAVRTKLLNELKDLNADYVATVANGLIRMPNSINSRTRNKNSVVALNYEYELQDLYLWAYEPKKSTKSCRQRFFSKHALYKRAHERLTDLRALLVYRSQNGHKTGFRNNLTYIYAYHSALVNDTNDEVYEDTLEAFIKAKAQMEEEKRFERTIRQAFIDANEFLEQYQKDNMRIVNREDDGIKKPQKTETIHEDLKIQGHEYSVLKFLVSDKERNIRKNAVDKARIESKRRENGVRTMNDYNADRKRQVVTKRTQALELLQEGYTRKEIAEKLEVNRKTVYRWLKP